MNRDRRHPAEVTSARLLNHLERWPDAFNGADRDMVSRIRYILQEIAEGNLGGHGARQPPASARFQALSDSP
ncbi:hypothetical protein [Nonomuraea sp. SYSU D8015]|uniref:hypothetical protein n=1 Tax=Nonomuraea sp. SYSU D8015 TaxID=2593644 RepID=UPI0016602517|nr:hypothetical protein [Nonomuraea sp. SYSU D8015]